MDTNAYADAICLEGGLTLGHRTGTGRPEDADRAVTEETLATGARRGKDGALEESQRKQSVDEALDDALAGTFPASDPIALAVLR